jgi:hypothetical protein
MIRSDSLNFRIYARHGDSCNCHPFNNKIECGSGFHPDDYVLSAAFSYFQEAIDIAMEWQKRGVSCKIISKVPGALRQVYDYPAAKK